MSWHSKINLSLVDNPLLVVSRLTVIESAYVLSLIIFHPMVRPP